MTGFSDDFDGPGLDTDVWIPHYLPQWSSRAESAATTYRVDGSELRLTIPPGQGLWCAGEHDPLRVSGIQSGVFSGAAGTTVGQQPFREGAVVREFQPAQWGWTPEYGRLEVRARMELSPRSMAAVWMVGLEDETDAVRRDLHLRGLRRRAGGRGPSARPPPSGWACIRSAIPRSATSSRPRGSISTSPPSTTTPRTGGPAASTS